jgi:hypothetical protein
LPPEGDADQLPIACPEQGRDLLAAIIERPLRYRSGKQPISETAECLAPDRRQPPALGDVIDETFSGAALRG